jgi:NADPH:quinone reductase-like Zn-dependent oxidoreductase
VLQLVPAGKYRVNVDRTLALADFQQAWDYSKAGHTRGKVVLANED